MDEKINNNCIGSSFDDFLEKEDLLNVCEKNAIRTVNQLKDRIDLLVEEWHTNINIKCSLQEHLNMTDAEYKMFLIGKCLEKENEFSWERRMS